MRALSLEFCPTLCTPMDCSLPGPLSVGFSRQEYWNELPCPPPGDLPNPETEPRSPALQADCLPSELPGKPVRMAILTNIGDGMNVIDKREEGMRVMSFQVSEVFECV